MKYLFTILMLWAASLKANDSTAAIHLTKAKNNALGSTALTTLGVVTTYYGITQQDKQSTALGYGMIIGGSILGTLAVYHYTVSNIMYTVSASEFKVSIRF
jgi:hypothetical protein